MLSFKFRLIVNKIGTYRKLKGIGVFSQSQEFQEVEIWKPLFKLPATPRLPLGT